MLLTRENIIAVIKDQLPLKRMIRNHILSSRGHGLFHINSHIATYSGSEKIKYGSKKSALKAAGSMAQKTGNEFSAYKCLYCDGFHVGKNQKKS